MKKSEAREMLCKAHFQVDRSTHKATCSLSIGDACEALGMPVVRREHGPMGAYAEVIGARHLMDLADVGADLGGEQQHYRDIRGSVKILRDARLIVGKDYARTSRTDVYDACNYLNIPATMRDDGMTTSIRIESAALKLAAKEYDFALSHQIEP